MSYVESVQTLVKDLEQGVYMPVQLMAAKVILGQAHTLDAFETEIGRLNEIEQASKIVLERMRDAEAEVIAFGMRK